MCYADVILDLSVEKLDRVFLYSIPDSLSEKAQVGVKVKVPFGRGGRELFGYIVGMKTVPDFDPERIKDIISVSDDIAVESRLIELAFWIKSRFGGTMSSALRTVLPVKTKVKHVVRTYYTLDISDAEADELLLEYGKKRYVAKVRFLSALRENGTIEKALLTKLGVTSAVVNAFLKDGLISISEKYRFRNPVDSMDGIMARTQNSEIGASKEDGSGGEEQGGIALNDVQKNVISRIFEERDSGKKRPSLIFGVTGSGKTAVYIEIVKRVVSEGKRAIVLIPEISLTFQTLVRFYNVFGDRVSILNSRMSNGERYDQYLRAKSGDIDVIIGPRSALFAPFENIGAVVIDEEHESSYKSGKTPRYDARAVAEHICEKSGAMLILGSATPSVDSFFRAKRG